MNSNLVTPKKIFDNSDSYMFNIEKNSIQDLKTAKDSRSPSLEEAECNPNFISRKTLRGRKEKLPLPKNKLKCEVCLEFSDFSKEDLISCSTCKCLFHRSCNNQFEIENSSYKCIRCSCALKLKQSIDDYKCFICGNSNGVLNMNSLAKNFYHKICVNLLNEFQGLEGKNICKENIRKWRYKNSCRYCGEKLTKTKVVMKCKNPKCKEYYHIPCAIEKGMLFDLNYMKQFYNAHNFAEIPFYCANHNKKISFLYKTHVKDGNNDLCCNKNLFQDENIQFKTEEKSPFLGFVDFSESKFIENDLNNTKNTDEKIKNDFIFQNDNNIAIIVEENNDKKIKEDLKDNNNDKDMDIDEDSFDNNKNDIFKLDFETMIKKEKENNDICFCGDICHNSRYGNFGCFNDNIYGNNDLLFNRQNSFDSIALEV